MKILALDFSSPQRSVAIWNGSAIASEVVDAAPGRDMRPFALVERALAAAGLQRESIDCLAVGLGPGSYTGIRVGISLAQGWQLATGIKLVGLSSVTAIAEQIAAVASEEEFCVVVDAQRGEFYAATYARKNGELLVRTPLGLAGRSDIEALQARGMALLGPEVTRWFPTGKVVYPQAATLARLAAASPGFISGETMEPIYLRETTFVKAAPARPLPFAL